MGDFVILTRPNTHQHIGSPTAQGVSSPLCVGSPVRIREEILVLLGGKDIQQFEDLFFSMTLG